MARKQRETRYSDDRYARWRMAILAVALVFHTGLGLLKFHEPTGDAAEYHALATNLVDDGSFGYSRDGSADSIRPTARRMPLYPLFLALLYMLAGGGENGYLVVAPVQSFLMVVNVALVMAIGRRLFGAPVALVAGVVSLFYQPYLFHLPTHLISDSLYLTLILSGLYALLRAEEGRWGLLAAAFFAFGLSIATRANGVLLLPVLFVWSWLSIRDRPRRWAMMLLFALCMTLPLVPWWIRNARAFDRFIPLSTNGGWNFYLGHNEAYAGNPGLGEGTDYAIFDHLLRDGRTEWEADRELYERGLAFASSRPWETVVNVLRKAKVAFSVTTLRTWNLVCVTAIVFGAVALRCPPGHSRHKSVGGALIAAGVVLWLIQTAYVFSALNRGLAGAGISFGLMGILGLAGMVVAFRRGHDHWLLTGLYLSQIAACLVYVPLTRIRWTVDFVVVLYAAVAIVGAAQWLFPQSYPQERDSEVEEPASQRPPSSR
ncbi:MAG: glycosyltransferase family 39 protein [Phycisphaerales bacterium]|nr:MAG: glycosyltransferase family 39 protein [Phycisphaerales bacterium]